jgi:enoyl-CoA hydratase
MISLERRDGTAHLILDRPPVNAIDGEQVELLGRRLDAITADADVRAVVIQGAGRAFCAGADVGMIEQLLAGADGTERLTAFAAALQRVFARIESLPVPTVAAIHGAAMGGGLELALACDVRIVERTARVGFPEATIGLLPGAGGTQRLTTIAGRAVALHLILGGDHVGGEEAHALGIAQLVAEPGGADADAAVLARRLAGHSREAMAAIKRCVAAAPEGFDAELEETRTLAGLDTTLERVRRFFERSQPTGASQ